MDPTMMPADTDAIRQVINDLFAGAPVTRNVSVIVGIAVVIAGYFYRSQVKDLKELIAEKWAEILRRRKQ